MKNIYKILLVLVLSLAMVACTAPAPKETPKAEEPKAEAPKEETKKEEPKREETKQEVKKENTDDGYYPVAIKTYDSDSNEIEMVFEKKPEKVLVAYQNSIEIMLKLGLADRVIAGFGLDGDVSEELKPEFAKLKYLENSPSKEDVLAMQPDFILGWYSVFLDQTYNKVDFWNERGVKTYMSLNSGGRPKGTIQKVEDEMQDILNIGKIFNVQDKAEAIVAETREEIAKIKEHVKDVKKVEIAILENQKDNFRVYGGNTLAGDVAISGGAELKVGKEKSENISVEQLIVANPEAIFMVWFDGYNTPEEAISDITNNPALSSLDAVKNNKVFAINLSNIYCSGLHTIDGVLIFAKNLYPEMYK